MKRRLITYVVLATAIVLMVVGIMQNQNLIVLGKAIKICLECVGIG